ncbi:MAG: DUF4367 domain-containing protein [Clostridia bacterium]|nr:DUF4367 domain-containing protein [Clostridia bacterium]
MKKTNPDRTNPSYESAVMRAVIQPLIAEELALFDMYNAIPHAYSQDFLHRLQKLFQRDRVLQSRRASVKWVKRIAVCLALAAAITLTACVAIKPLRDNMTEAIVSLYTHYVGIQFSSEATASVPKKPMYLPEGYELILESDAGGYYTACYRKGWRLMEFLRYPDDMGEIVYDNINHTIENVNIGRISGILLSGANKCPNILTWSEQGYTYSIHGYADKEELMRIAENIQ